MTQVDTTPLDPPGGVLTLPDMRVQEIMYGHRITSDQEPYMILLEVLTICETKPLGSEKAGENSHEEFSYGPKQRKKMRFLVFSDRHLERVVMDNQISDARKWSAWKEKANEQFDPASNGDGGHDHFSYLDEPFDCDLSALFQAVQILRSQELDVSNRRRWTSRFLAPKGRDMLCDDVRQQKNREWKRDRRFFTRGGELVYLMLNRSSRPEDVQEKVEEKFLNPRNSINQIANRLSDSTSGPTSNEAEVGYLPLRNHEIYNQMADDWISILSIDEVPKGYLFDPLFRITGLNLFRYFALVGKEILGEKKPEPIVVDVGDGRDVQMRESAKEHLMRHRAVVDRAIEEFVRGKLMEDGWDVAVKQNSPSDAREIIVRNFLRKKADGSSRFEETARYEPEEQLRRMIKHFQSRPQNNTNTFILPLTKGIGLVTSRSSAGTWFALDDSMIIALVLAIVSDAGEIELQEFTSRLYQRYGLVIGPEEARIEFGTPPVGIHLFQKNLMDLENRMTRLALTRRLSDDCAFAINPYRARS